MARFLRKNKKEIGLAPDELLFRGEQKIEKVLLRVIDYNADDFEEHTLENVAEVEKYAKSDSVTWLNVDGLHSPQIMAEIAKVFELDQLVLAAVMETNTRARVQEHENCLLISIKMLQHDAEEETVRPAPPSTLHARSALIRRPLRLCYRAGCRVGAPRHVAQGGALAHRRHRGRRRLSEARGEHSNGRR